MLYHVMVYYSIAGGLVRLAAVHDERRHRPLGLSIV